MKKICDWQSTLNRPSLAFQLLTSIEDLFESHHLLNNSEALVRLIQSIEQTMTTSASPNEGTDSPGTKNWPSPKGLCEFINCIANLKNLSQNDLKNLALNSLILANSPLAKYYDQQLYERFLRKLLSNNLHTNIKRADLIAEQTSEFISITTNQAVLNQVSFIFGKVFFFS
jgi:hypothetical protein